MNTIYVQYISIYIRVCTYTHELTCSPVNTNGYLLMVILMPTHKKPKKFLIKKFGRKNK